MPAPRPGPSTSAGGRTTRPAGERSSAPWRQWSGSSPARGHPPRPGPAAPTARSASGHWLDDAVGAARHGAARPGGPRAARQHRPHRRGPLGHLGHRHQALPGPAGAPRPRRLVRPASPPLRGRPRPEPPRDLRRAGSRRWSPRRWSPRNRRAARWSGSRCASPARRSASSPGPSPSRGCSSPGPGTSPGRCAARRTAGPGRAARAGRPPRPRLPALHYAPGGTSHRPTGASPRR